jgi:ComF family protein
MKGAPLALRDSDSSPYEPWRKACREVLDFLLPSRCLGCDDRIPLESSLGLVCDGCLSRLREPPWPRCPRCHFPSGTGRTSDACLVCREWTTALSVARSAVILEHPADRLVHALKYEGWRELAPLMGRRMLPLELPAGVPTHALLVVPVPTTARRRRQRGYNQAALIAESFASQAGLDYADALERASTGGSQVSLTPSQRHSNVRDSFAPASGRAARVLGKHVLLVDDVLTTGATACEAALALERAGAGGVSLFTFARALPDRRRVRPGAS